MLQYSEGGAVALYCSGGGAAVLLLMQGCFIAMYVHSSH